jgi:hypothetical protein
MKHALLPFETKRDPHRLADWTEQLRRPQPNLTCAADAVEIWQTLGLDRLTDIHVRAPCRDLRADHALACGLAVPLVLKPSSLPEHSNY